MATVDSDSLSQALGAGGELAQRFNEVWEQLWQQDHVPPRILEMCRLRLATLLGADAEYDVRMVGGLGAGSVAALRGGTYTNDPGFGPPERALLDFAEVYAMDPSAISDAQADAVKQHVGEPGLVCFIEALGFIEGRIRLGLMFSALGATH